MSHFLLRVSQQDFSYCGCQLTRVAIFKRLKQKNFVMKLLRLLVCGLIAVSTIPDVTIAETYSETFECDFGKGMANRPTPTHVVFSVDGRRQSALLHEVEMRGIDTPKRSALINRNSFRILSISWPGDTYTFSRTGRRTRGGDPRRMVLDLGRQEFSIFLDRQTMKAIASSKSNVQASHDGNANGTCVEVQFTN